MSSSENDFIKSYGSKSKLTEGDVFGFQTKIFETARPSRSWRRQQELMGNTIGFLQQQSSEIQGFRGSVARGITGVGNRINDYLRDKGRGYIASGFSTVGEVVGAAPLKSLAKSYGVGSVMMAGIEFGLSGKPMTAGNILGLLSDNVAMTASFELAGGGLKGIGSAMGWGMLGSELGLGAWGSLGLQAAGSLALPGLGWTVGGAMLAYKAGQGVVGLGQMVHDIGKKSRQVEFATQDMSWQSQHAATMRERALGAIQNSHLNMRQVLGNEARMLMMAR